MSTLAAKAELHLESLIGLAASHICCGDDFSGFILKIPFLRRDPTLTTQILTSIWGFEKSEILRTHEFAAGGPAGEPRPLRQRAPQRPACA